jgi:N-acyl-D-aspartate/D-glutamate deacylase
MSQRHRDAELPMQPKQELRAHAHSERHRIHVQLSNVATQVSAGLDPADVHEPGAAWKPEHHKDPEVARSKLAKRSRTKRHWKTKMWKRRTALRQARAAALKLAPE